MYAIFEAKGKQFRAERGSTLRLPSLDAQPGDTVTFDQVLLAEGEDGVAIGRPAVQGATVSAEVVRHGKGEKIVVFKMKRRKGYRRKQGHRQRFTEIRVLDIEVGGGARATKSRKAAKDEAPPPKPEKKAAKPEPEAKAAAPPEASAEAPPVEIEATGSARQLAEEHDIDLAGLEGTGKDGRILKGDVEKAIKERDEG